jgi:hypothetical protein
LATALGNQWVDAGLIPLRNPGDQANDPCNYRSNLSRATDVGHERVGGAQEVRFLLTQGRRSI